MNASSPLLLVLLMLSLANSPASATAAQAQALSPAATWQLAEFRLVDVPTAANPFDPEQVQVDATFTAPSGARVRLPAFWHQEYQRSLDRGAETLEPTGRPEWRLRYRPTEPGIHAVSVSVRTGEGPATEGEAVTFDVAAAAPETSVGWVRVHANRRHFATSEGQALLLNGHNLCWPTARGTYDYDDWFAELAAAGQNFARLWLAPWWAPLEHVPGTLTHYRLDAAWQLDQVFAAAERHGIYLMLCLDHHGMYQRVDPTWGGSNAFWLRNPYSREQGGPCATPADFFRSEAAKATYQKRLRYLIGRYSHSPRLMAWQFFNEIDNIFDRAPVDEATVVAWHVEMARWLRAHDPYQHVISTSLTGGVDRPAFWQLPEMEFSSYHAYWDPAPARRLGALMQDFAERYDKPALIGEFGVNGGHWDAPADPHLRGFRQHLWGAPFGGSASVALSWWWQDLHGDGALRLEETLANFLRELGWFEGGWMPARVISGGRPPTDLAEPDANAAPFTAHVALNPFRRLRLDNTFALANPLAGERASEHLSAVLWGSAEPTAQRPLQLTVWTDADGRGVVRVQETTGPAVLVARVDGREVGRETFSAGGPVGKELVLPLPPGKHRVELANEGTERIVLASLRIDGARPASWAGNWAYEPETLALQKGDRAALYLVAPGAVYPAGSIRYGPPAHPQSEVTLLDWPAGEFTVRWIDPETGAEISRSRATTRTGRLSLTVPSFPVDLAGIVAQTSAP